MMKTPNAILLLTLSIAAACGGAAQAQSTVAKPAPPPNGASAVQSKVPGPNPTQQSVENARPPGEMRPELPVKPQITIPFKGVDANKLPPGKAGTSKAVKGGIDDSAARCLAIADAAERTRCEQKAAAAAAAAAKPAR